MIIHERLARISAELVTLQSELVAPTEDQKETALPDVIKVALLVGKVEAMRAILNDIRESLKDS